MKVFLITPSFNEGQRTIRLIKNINLSYPKLPIVVVDDGSAKSLKLPPNLHAKLLRHQVNLGKGAALKTGAEYAFTHGASAVIFMDSDGQHDPKDISVFIKNLNAGFDIVFGSRRPGLNTPLIRFLGNKLAAVYMNLVFGVFVSDILSGFRGLSRRGYQYLRWNSSRYGVETEMIARLGKYKQQLKFIEVPIENIYIDKYKGVTIIDAIKILISSLWWKLF